MNKQTLVRISSLAKTLESVEKMLETMLEAGLIGLKTQEEIDAFRRGVKTTLNLVRTEYGINRGETA